MSSFEQCFLCKSGFSRAKDKYLIQGRSKENLAFELNGLPFSLTFNSTDYLCRSCVNTLKKRRSLIEQLKQIEERFKSFHQSTKVTSPSTGLKRSLQDEDVTSGKKTHIAESEGDEQVSEVAINVLQSTPVKSSSSINPKFVCLESPVKANQATIERITFIRTPKNQSQNTIIYSTNHELSPEFLRTASCLEQTNTLICIDGNNTHSVFPSMLRRLIFLLSWALFQHVR